MVATRLLEVKRSVMIHMCWGNTPSFISITVVHFDNHAFRIFRNGWLVVEMLFMLFSVYNIVQWAENEWIQSVLLADRFSTNNLFGACKKMIIYFIYLFIKTLQHKCWRSVGHQVLQPAKDVKLGQYVWKVADRRKKSRMHQDSLEPAAIQFTLTGVCQAIRTFSSCFFYVLWWSLKKKQTNEHKEKLLIFLILVVLID